MAPAGNQPLSTTTTTTQFDNQPPSATTTTTRFDIRNVGIPEANKFTSIIDNITYYTYEPVNADTYTPLNFTTSNRATKYTGLTQIDQTSARRVLLSGKNTFIQSNFNKSSLYYIEVSNVQPTIL